MRRDARRVFMKAIPISPSNRHSLFRPGWSLFDVEKHLFACGLTLTEAEHFVYGYAVGIGAMTRKGRWLVDDDGNRIEKEVNCYE